MPADLGSHSEEDLLDLLEVFAWKERVITPQEWTIRLNHKHATEALARSEEVA